MLRKLLTGTQVVIGVVGIAPVDLELVSVPVGVRHITVVIARTRLIAWFHPFITDNLWQDYLC